MKVTVQRLKLQLNVAQRGMLRVGELLALSKKCLRLPQELNVGTFFSRHTYSTVIIVSGCQIV